MEIVEAQADTVRIKTANGTTLTCQAVRQMPVQDLLLKLGFADMLSRDANDITTAMQHLTTAQQLDTARAAMALFNYTMAHGIVESPPAEAVAELRELGVAPDSLPALRAVWLDYLVLRDAAEAGEVVGIILGLTFKPAS